MCIPIFPWHRDRLAIIIIKSSFEHLLDGAASRLLRPPLAHGAVDKEVFAHSTSLHFGAVSVCSVEDIRQSEPANTSENQ